MTTHPPTPRPPLSRRSFVAVAGASAGAVVLGAAAPALWRSRADTATASAPGSMSASAIRVLHGIDESVPHLWYAGKNPDDPRAPRANIRPVAIALRSTLRYPAAACLAGFFLPSWPRPCLDLYSTRRYHRDGFPRRVGDSASLDARACRTKHPPWELSNKHKYLFEEEVPS